MFEVNKTWTSSSTCVDVDTGEVLPLKTIEKTHKLVRTIKNINREQKHVTYTKLYRATNQLNLFTE